MFFPGPLRNGLDFADTDCRRAYETGPDDDAKGMMQMSLQALETD
jgi:hypothetical protein